LIHSEASQAAKPATATVNATAAAGKTQRSANKLPVAKPPVALEANEEEDADRDHDSDEPYHPNPYGMDALTQPQDPVDWQQSISHEVVEDNEVPTSPKYLEYSITLPSRGVVKYVMDYYYL